MEAFTEKIKQSALKAAMVAQTTLATTNGFLDDMAANDEYVQSEGYNQNSHQNNNNKKNNKNIRSTTSNIDNNNKATMTTNKNNTTTTTYDDQYHNNKNHTSSSQIEFDPPLPKNQLNMFNTTSDFDDDDDDDASKNHSWSTMTPNVPPPPPPSTTAIPKHPSIRPSSLRPHRFMEDLDARLAQEILPDEEPVPPDRLPPPEPLSSWFTNAITTNMRIPVPSSILPFASSSLSSTANNNNNNNNRKSSSTAHPPPLSRTRNTRQVSFYDDKNDHVELVSSITMLDPSEIEQLEQLRLLEHSSSSSSSSSIAIGMFRHVLSAILQQLSACCGSHPENSTMTMCHRKEIRMMIIVLLVLGGGYIYFGLEAKIIAQTPV